MIRISDLVNANAAAAGIDLRAAIGGEFPVRTAYRHLGNYQCRLGGASLSSLAAAIANAEGANVPGSVPQRANNPGNLELGGNTITAAGGQKITVFPSLEAGQAALENQIQRIISGSSKAGYTPDMSIAQVADIWVSGVPNSGNGRTWANNVASYLGVSPNDSFSAQAGAEGGNLVPMSLAAINDTIAAETGYVPPAWFPYLVAGVALYLVVDYVS